MLRKTYHPFKKKELPVPPLYASTLKEVLVQRTNPLNGDVTDTYKEIVSSREAIPESAHVQHIEADVYSIDNQMKVGLQPVFAGSNYLTPDLDNLGAIEDTSISILDQISAERAQQHQTSNKEPEKSVE